MAPIDVGAKAPSFSLQDQDGKSRTLADFVGRPVVIYFYPEDGSPSCTDQACQVRDLSKDFRHLGVVVMGVSPDDTASHARFASKHALGFSLLADVPGKGGVPAMADAFGVWQQKSMYGKAYMGVVRTTFLIDADGKVAERWDRVRVKGHVAEVLAAAKRLVGGVASGATEDNVASRGRNLTKKVKRSASMSATTAPAKKKAGTPTSARARSKDSDPPFSPVRGSTGSRKSKQAGVAKGMMKRAVKKR
jgi:peroxiredoxin Q/BCP